MNPWKFRLLYLLTIVALEFESRQELRKGVDKIFKSSRLRRRNTVAQLVTAAASSGYKHDWAWSWDRIPAHRPLSCGFTHPLKATHVFSRTRGILCLPAIRAAREAAENH